MGKTRAEIQKAYRDRKKQNDPSYLKKEATRQAKYRVPAAMLNTKQLEERHIKNRGHCLKYRLNKATQRQISESSERSTTAEPSSVFQSNEVSSSSEPSTSTATPQSTRSSGTNRLLVKLPFTTRSQQSQRRSKALRNARAEIQQLKLKLTSETKKSKRFQKRFERLSTRVPTSSKTRGPNAETMLTPKSKTASDLRRYGLSPRRIPRPVRRKLQLGNALFSEIRSSFKANSSEQNKSLINRVISGNIIKKYRFLSTLNKETGASLRRCSSNTSKTLTSIKRRRQTCLKQQLLRQVSEYFGRDDVSRCMPGKRDCVKVDGEKKQARILNDYLSNLHEKFLMENPSVHISLSAFCKMRPAHIRLTSLLSRNKCLCTKHQNMALKLKCLINLGIQVSPNPEVVSRTVSKDHMIQMLKEIKADDNVEYEEWRCIDIDGKKRMRIVKDTESGKDFTEMMTQKFQDFLDHVSRVTMQYKALHELKQNLPTDHVIVQMDFAENFLCQTMDEIQSAYWNATAATIHPVVIYHKDNSGTMQHTNISFVSDVNHHNSTAVYAILKRLIPEIKSILPNVTTVHYWTDSPSSQYRNRFMFAVVARHRDLFNITARWNYFEAGHGKGPCDGIGGTSKRMAAQAVKQGKATIQDGYDFYKWASQNEKSIQYFFYSQNEYDDAFAGLSAILAKPVPGTLKLHAVYSNGDGNLYVRATSCYCSACLEWDQQCNGWIKHSLYSVPSEEMPTTDSPTVSEIHVPSEACAAAFPVSFIPLRDQMVAAVYDNDWYIGKVVDVDISDSDALVSFMSKHTVRGKLQLQWPPRPDEIWVSFDQLITIVDEPQPLGRSRRYYTVASHDFQTITHLMTERQL